MIKKKEIYSSITITEDIQVPYELLKHILEDFVIWNARNVRKGITPSAERDVLKQVAKYLRMKKEHD